MPDPIKVYPSGLTLAEAEELHGHVINGTRIFGAIAVVAHILSYLLTPWLR
jgi:light-harvesting protein B-800-850 beta chain